MSPPVLLCIDDRSAALEVRKANLEKRGYSVLTANNAPTAISMLGNTAVAAVLLEYKSEGMDAEAVALNIKRRFPREPIVLLSAYSELPERILWLVDEYVMKSAPLDGLVQIIERVRSSVTTTGGDDLHLNSLPLEPSARTDTAERAAPLPSRRSQ